MLRLSFLNILLPLCILFAACKEEIVPHIYQPVNAHDSYRYGLEQAGLLHTALGQDWLRIAASSLETATPIEAPFEEIFYSDPGAAQAHAYRFEAKRGHKIEIDLSGALLDSARVFIDLFRIYGELAEYFEQVASADTIDHKIGFEPRRDGTYALRVQPELLRGGSLKISVRTVPAFSFPVAGGNNRDIGSFFGDPRDGGRRKHHGIDIFASRHTPIVAPVDGHVRFVGTRGLGGKVIWLFEEQRGMHLYFAHLQDWLVGSDTYVRRGDTLGTVGNTGNAKRTPPHLHFGIYRNGPMDPYHFVAKVDDTPDPVQAQVALLGQKARTLRKTVMESEMQGGNIELERHQMLTIRGASENQYRVEMPDGRGGYVASNHLEVASTALDLHALESSSEMYFAPHEQPLAIANCAAGEEIEFLGRTRDFWFIRNQRGEQGWIPMP